MCQGCVKYLSPNVIVNKDHLTLLDSGGLPANQRHDKTMASVGSKPCNKRQKEGYFAICAVGKLLPKEKVVGM